jgi:predicted transposase YdaD
VPDHDQYFKQLLQTCFGDLVRIVAPEIAPKLRLDHPTFLESELFTDLPDGEHRRLDLVAQVASVRGDPELVLVHVEVEAQARPGMGRRLAEYSMQLWLRHHRPLIPIVVYLRGGTPDVSLQSEALETFGRPFLVFHYHAFGLSRSRAAKYVRRPEPLAWALAALMRHRGLSAAEHQIACLRPLAQAPIDDARKFLLMNFVDSYVQLDESEREEYETLLADERNREVAAMTELTLTTNADRLVRKSYIEGLEQGQREGREHGEREGREHGQRELLLLLLARRFGTLPEATTRRIQALTSPEELARLAERVLDAASLDDLGL